VRDEFEHFWAQGVDLPDAVVKHVAAMASRIEYRSIEAARDAAGNISADAVLDAIQQSLTIFSTSCTRLREMLRT
jgi:hypothetical protein